MDFLSHILVGKIISSRQKKTAQLWAMFFSFLPDLSLIPFYLVLGLENSRAFLLPYNQDWLGASVVHPFLTSLYFLQHSFLFSLIIILPLIFYFKLPKTAFLGYFLHIAIDIPTHTGEWAIKIFYPFNYAINGFTDAWAWPLYYMFLSWAMLLVVIAVLSFINKKYKRI